LTWKSDAESTATVSQNGVVTAVAPGTAKITASSEDGLSCSCEVTVLAEAVTPTPTDSPTPTPTEIPQAESISLNKTTLSMKAGASDKLVATVLPADAADTTVTWKSGNTKVVKVGKTGKVVAVAAGTAKIRAMTANGRKAFCTVTVKDAESITLNAKSKALYVGLTFQLKATVTPSGTAVTWKSSNTKVAKVSTKGLVTAVRSGTCKISATTKGGKTATCTITVKQKYVYELEKDGVYRYLTSTSTIKKLAKQGWTYKKAFRAAGKSTKPVYQIYDKSTKRFRYTTDKSLAVKAKKSGNQVGIAFYGSEAKSIPVYELAKKSGKTTLYYYTTNKTMVAAMKKEGWTNKGIAWYAELKSLS
ncbi:MAG: Ig-like domain-containing protein, partial [Lachnospiraceae bacterium]